MWPLLEGSDYSRAASNQRSTEIEEIWYIILSRDSIKLNAKMLPDANIWIHVHNRILAWFVCCWHFENVSLMEHSGQLM